MCLIKYEWPPSLSNQYSPKSIGLLIILDKINCKPQGDGFPRGKVVGYAKL